MICLFTFQACYLWCNSNCRSSSSIRLPLIFYQEYMSFKSQLCFANFLYKKSKNISFFSFFFSLVSSFFILPVWSKWKSWRFHACKYYIDADLCYKILLVGSWLLEHNGHCSWSRFTYSLIAFILLMLVLQPLFLNMWAERLVRASWNVNWTLMR